PADRTRAGGGVRGPGRPSPAPPRAPTAVGRAAWPLRAGGRAVLLLGGDTRRRPGLVAASRIAAATGAVVLAENAPARQERGAGLPAVHRLAYLGAMVAAQPTDPSLPLLARAP